MSESISRRLILLRGLLGNLLLLGLGKRFGTHFHQGLRAGPYLRNGAWPVRKKIDYPGQLIVERPAAGDAWGKGIPFCLPCGFERPASGFRDSHVYAAPIHRAAGARHQAAGFKPRQYFAQALALDLYLGCQPFLIQWTTIEALERYDCSMREA